MDLSVIDGLPWVDTDIDQDAGLRLEIESMIQSEGRILRKSNPNEIFDKLLEPLEAPLFHEDQFLQDEYTRVTEQKVDPTRYEFLVNDEKEGFSKEDQAKIKLMNEENHLVNLELLKKFGPSAHNIMINYHSNLLKTLKVQKLSIERDSLSINRKRKISQLNGAMELEEMQMFFKKTADKNNEIRKALTKLKGV